MFQKSCLRCLLHELASAPHNPTGMPKLLLIDSEIEPAHAAREFLLAQGHAVDLVLDGNEAIELLKARDYDVVLLDADVTGMRGIDLCRTYRSQNGYARILMYSARSSSAMKTEALDSGADDYIQKPFDLNEINARIRALMRRSLSMTGAQIVVCDLVLDLPNHRVLRDNQEIQLQPQEFVLLEYLMRHPDRLFSAEHLVKRVWRGISSVNTVRTHIKTLRKKIDLPGLPVLIRTVHGVGYGIASFSTDDEPLGQKRPGLVSPPTTRPLLTTISEPATEGEPNT